MILLGDMTSGLKEILWKQMSKVIERYSHLREPYWILVVIKQHYEGPKDSAKQVVDVVLKGKPINITLVIIRSASQLPPVRQLGTALFRIDNRTGTTKCLYVLPVDAPDTQESLIVGASELVDKSVQGIPLIHGN